eukprot:scaffold109025_cov26-Tisochrysis_lutea.AAC.1
MLEGRGSGTGAPAPLRSDSAREKRLSVRSISLSAERWLLSSSPEPCLAAPAAAPPTLLPPPLRARPHESVLLIESETEGGGRLSAPPAVGLEARRAPEALWELFLDHEK